MATLIVEIDDALDQALTSEAARNGLSKIDYVRQLLRENLPVQPTNPPSETAAEWLSELREQFANIGYAEDLVALIPPRHELPRSADFRALHQAADASPPSPTGAAFLAQLRTRFAHRYAEDLELPPRDNPLREVDLGQP
jgi:plasmid stability protein